MKLKQIVYQFYYRIKSSKTLSAYLEKLPANVDFHYLSFTNAYQVSGQVNDADGFTFLNLTHQFKGAIDWDFQGYGKLWNYNLQYFNYLHQPDLPDSQKQLWLAGMGNWLKDGRLKLEPYPVSLRSMNSIRYFSGKEIQDQALIRQTYAELTYLEQNLEFHILGNHLLENAFALMMGAYAFKQDNWKVKAKSLLKEELEEQILNDGAHFELSPMYHQIILFRVLELIDWYSKVNDRDEVFLAFIRQKAAEMLGWLQAMTFANGEIPHFNDSSSGITFTSAELIKFALNLDLKPAADTNLNQSGYRKFKDDVYECVVDVGPVGPSYQPGHSHSDALSFILHVRKQPVLVEAGTSTYQIGERRDYERSTRAHNTVVVGDQNQSEVWGGFRVGDRANVFINQETPAGLVAHCDGYLKKFGVLHQRSFSFVEQGLSIKDELSGSTGLIAKAYFHFHPDCVIHIREDGQIDIENTGLIILNNALSYTLSEYKYATGYNLYKNASVLIVEFKQKLETTFKFNTDFN